MTILWNGDGYSFLDEETEAEKANHQPREIWPQHGQARSNPGGHPETLKLDVSPHIPPKEVTLALHPLEHFFLKAHGTEGLRHF